MFNCRCVYYQKAKISTFNRDNKPANHKQDLWVYFKRCLAISGPCHLEKSSIFFGMMCASGSKTSNSSCDQDKILGPFCQKIFDKSASLNDHIDT